MRLSWLILPLVFLCTAQLRADSITLVNGEKITGTIKSDTGSEITIDVPVSASITDERVIRKEDIAKVEKELPDQIAYNWLITIQPNAELSYSAQTYSQILGYMDDFLTKYPSSTYVPEIKKLADTFRDEKKRVDAGELKYMGQWLSKDEAARRRIQIVALEVYDGMQKQASDGDLAGAMQTFEAIERDYPTTRIFPQAITLAQQILARLQQDLVVRMEEVKADQAQLKKTVDFNAEPEKSRIIAAAKAEQDRGNAAVEAALRNGSKWVPLIPRNQVSIDTLQKIVISETARLAALPVTAMNRSIEKVDGARDAFSGGDFKTADSLLKDATVLWAQNEAAHYWADRLKENMAAPTPSPAPTAAAASGITLSTVPRPTPHPANIVAATPAQPEEKPFYMTISGAILIAALILIIGGGAAAYTQKKARQATAE